MGSNSRQVWLGPLALFAVCAMPVQAAESAAIRWSGELAGRVIDAAGVPQMGAVVMLFNRYDRHIARLVTGERGLFSFEALTPDSYSVRVSLSAFMPATKRNISIQAGLRSFLTINLTSMLSSIELVYLSPGQAPIMSEDWKWVLRAGSSIRPILRYTQGVDISDPNRPVARASNIFSGTRGVFSLSSGEGGALASAGNQTDLGTSFALATSIYGANRVSVSGNVGYASHSGTSTAGFRTSYSRDTANGPQVNVTMRQVFLPSRIGMALASGRNDGMPALQTLSVSFIDRIQASESVQLEYGSSVESVSFLDRLNFASPFCAGALGVGRVRGSRSSVQLGYSGDGSAQSGRALGHRIPSPVEHAVAVPPRDSSRRPRACTARRQCRDRVPQGGGQPDVRRQRLA